MRFSSTALSHVNACGREEPHTELFPSGARRTQVDHFCFPRADSSLFSRSARMSFVYRDELEHRGHPQVGLICRDVEWLALTELASNTGLDRTASIDVRASR